MARDLHGKSFLRESRRMTEEPRPLNSASSPFLLIDPAVLRTLTTSKSTTDIRSSAGYSPAQNGAPGQDGVHMQTGVQPVRNWTQTDQDETDAENRKNAMKELVKSWMDRLQLISVITTFFAATETQLLVITTPVDDDTPESRTRSAANAILAGALVIHLCAAIISFLAAFFLVRYRLKEAAKEEIKIETGITPTSSKSALKTGIWTANPHLEEMGPFRRGGPPTRLLEHLHTLCMWLAVVGFALALAGALCYTWARLSRSASIFASACMAVSWFAALGAVFIAL
ncbi:uncharacterized protein B0H18DRAFT_1022596 [Fomitopsis serialis]|uniref:uncharacterized protein n=1 Tax=Fomitopsis serialis TaxID=139415 RepID=UPI002007AC23|nr:uncharacterized protein B0H18DRAFT_1022596 [Neoantrodia serialis]KAH9920903.1 hypothetical protein B0H18DRAFT_1022596 [Neoantrodia serialis]